MSFSSVVKNELCRMEAVDNCCLFAELAAVAGITGAVKFVGNNEASIRIVTENAAIARRVFSIIKRIFNIHPEVTIRRSKKFKKHISYTLIVTESMGVGRILQGMGISYPNDGDKREDTDYFFTAKGVIKKGCCRKAFLRGAFLAGGSVSDPEKTYHLEITCHKMNMALRLKEIINKYKLNAKIIKRKGSFVTYIKEGEDIVVFLNVIGAHSALLELENVRILKEMRNNVNRIVNCETANLEKTVNASLRQIENIKYIKDTIGFGSLPKSLREIAEVRLANTDANLKELGEMLSPVLGKSGVNHRLRKLDRIAENVRSQRGEF